MTTTGERRQRMDAGSRAARAAYRSTSREFGVDSGRPRIVWWSRFRTVRSSPRSRNRLRAAVGPVRADVVVIVLPTHAEDDDAVRFGHPLEDAGTVDPDASVHGYGTGRQLEPRRHDGSETKSDGPPDLRSSSTIGFILPWGCGARCPSAWAATCKGQVFPPAKLSTASCSVSTCRRPSRAWSLRADSLTACPR